MSDPAVPPAAPEPGASAAASPPQPAPQAPAPSAETPPVLPTTPPVIDTRRTDLQDGVNRCPRCGSTDIVLRPATGLLFCNFCRYEWSEENAVQAFGLDTPIDQLRGTTIASGAKDIAPDASSIVTLKCQACGAEVVIDTAHAMHARCHWCRHTLTINDQIPNGAVPDAVLPFRMTHDEAVERIRAFAGKRRMFALGRFKKEFTPENVVGVYLPYMVVDGNVSSDVAGQGEVLTRRYTRRVGNNTVTYYDADVYAVHRHVDFTVDDLTIESSRERANLDTRVNTNNIINTILPFDTKNAVKWNADYLVGFTSEKRDTDVAALRPELDDQLMSIGRAQVEASVAGYDRGVRWEQEKLDVKGTRWVAMYLPVWLYSYYQEEKRLLHYIAVNARTGETMGSIPVQTWKLLLVSLATGTIIESAVVAFLGALLW